ncbi:MAG: RNA polymerase sigma factor, partial [Clostridia bacterium]|nr:RNA polymerase sigma factor [Clostridia bacterium]
DMLYRIAYSQLGSREDAEDAVQDVFSSYMTSSPDYDSEEHEKAWFIRSLVNRCHDQQRKTSVRSHDSLEDHADVAAEDSAETSLAAESMAQKLSLLPEKIRKVVVLHYLEGFSVEETARLLKTTPAAVKMRLSRGRAMYRKIEEDIDV